MARVSFIIRPAVNITVNKVVDLNIFNVRAKTVCRHIAIHTQLGRNQWNVNMASGTLRRCVKIVFSIFLYGLIMLRDK